MNDFELRRQLRQLRSERAPSRDLWAGIAERLSTADVSPSEPSTPNRWRWLGPAMAASVAICGLLLALTNRPVATQTDRHAESKLTARMTLRTADGLALEYSAALKSLPPVAAPAELQADLQLLDNSAEQLRVALRAQPHSLFLLTKLQRVYALRLQLSRPTWLT